MVDDPAAQDGHFDTAPLSLSQWALVVGVGSVIVVAEIDKALLRRREGRSRGERDG